MRRRVILVEDDDAIRSLLTWILEHEGFQVSGVGSIAEFHAMEGRETADLYLIDVGLPDGSGISVLREVAQYPGSGVIVLTARAEETDKVIGLELGADDFVTKPFRRRELLARINAVLRRVAPEDPSPRLPFAAEQVGDAELSFDGYRVRWSSRQVFAPDNEEVSLTTAEFDLLMAFLRRRGQTLSRERLISLLNGRGREVNERMIDGLVSRLRRKLPPPEGRSSPFIRTIHGTGYAFTD